MQVRKILLVAKRDYQAVVMRKAFLIGLVVAPLLFGGGIFAVALTRVSQGSTARQVAIVDRTGTAAPFIVAAAEAKSKQDNSVLAGVGASRFADPGYAFVPIPPDSTDPEGQRVTLSNRVRSHELFAFVEIGPDALNPPKRASAASSDKPQGLVAYYTDSQGAQSRAWIVDAINNGIRRARLAKLGIDSGRFDDLMMPLPVDDMSLVTAARTPAPPRHSPGAAIGVPFVLMFLMMMIAMMGSAPMLTAVAEDKTQRVFEMLLASATPFDLIAGKVVASVGLSLTSSVFYIAGGLLVLDGLAMMGIAPLALLPWFFIFLICDVIILSSLGAALGSACNAPQDAQQLMMLVILPVIAPVFLIAPLTEQPNGLFATVASLIPPFTPMVMMLRQAMPGGVPAWEPWIGLIGVLLWTALMTFAAARIFRVGILMQGQTPKLPELFRWALRG